MCTPRLTFARRAARIIRFCTICRVNGVRSSWQNTRLLLGCRCIQGEGRLPFALDKRGRAQDHFVFEHLAVLVAIVAVGLEAQQVLVRNSSAPAFSPRMLASRSSRAVIMVVEIRTRVHRRAST